MYSCPESMSIFKLEKVARLCYLMNKSQRMLLPSTQLQLVPWYESNNMEKDRRSVQTAQVRATKRKTNRALENVQDKTEIAVS